MPDRELAARVLDEITTRPEHHDQSAWMAGPERLEPQEELGCGTTLCVASHTVRLAGYTLIKIKIKDEGIEEVRVETEEGAEEVSEVAQQVLGLTYDDAMFLFDPELAASTTRAVLEQLAAGAEDIDYRLLPHD